MKARAALVALVLAVGCGGPDPAAMVADRTPMAQEALLRHAHARTQTCEAQLADLWVYAQAIEARLAQAEKDIATCGGTR